MKSRSEISKKAEETYGPLKQRIIMAVCVAVFIILITVVGNYFWSESKKMTIDTNTSPDNKYSVVLEQIDNTSEYGYATYRLLFKEGDDIKKRKTDTLKHGSPKLNQDNWSVVWDGGKVEVTLLPSQQDPVIVTFSYE